MQTGQMNDLDIFINSPDEATPEELSLYLDEACGDDPALRHRVEDLFTSRRRPEKFMEHTTFPAAAQDLIDTESAGSIIGNYKLLQKIGEGGFGVVYMADQLAPVKRRVALKIIKLGMDTKQVVARFEVERQALAMMEHPSIAKVYDAGATELGRPYFVMELVRGVSITEFCEDQKLDTEARLSLFMDVCSAIQHAHQKGIIHRDLKPGNVIVTLHDDKAVPKVIDFGVAKATQQDLTDKTLFTQFEQFIGTPAYMSPEQTQMSGLDIDTRSDIYALGVLLYELLTGTTPFEAKALANAGQDEIRRVIREDEPPRPSTRLTELQKRTLSHPETRSPGGHIDRDLDWVVMKALEKDRTRRYDNAAGLAADIKRHLAHEPVEAGPPGFSYRFGKTFRRHRTAIITSAAMIVLLAGAAVVSTTKGMEARSSEKVAVGALIDAEKAEGSAVWQKRVAEARLAEERFTGNKPEWGIPLFTNLIRSNPSGDLINRVAIERLMFAIRYQTIPRKMTPPFQSLSRPSPLSFNGEYMVTTTPVGDSNLLGLQVCSTKNGEVRGGKMTVKKGWRPNMARFSVDETHLLVSSSSGTGGKTEFQLWNWRLGKKVGEASKLKGNVMEISPDGNLAMCAGFFSVHVWETKGESPEKYEHSQPGGLIRGAAFSPDSKLIAFGYADGSVKVFEARSGDMVGKPMLHKNRIRDLTFDSTGERLLTASADGTARMWNVFTGEEFPNSPLVHQSGVNSVEFSPDDSMILTGSSDKTARLWDGASLKPFGAPMQHKDRVISAHFDSKGHQILTATEGAFWLWSVGSSVPIVEGQTRNQLRGAFFSKDRERVFTATDNSPSQIRAVRPAQPRSQVFRHYQALGQPARNTDWVNSARFSHDGEQFITSGVDGIVRIWDVALSLEKGDFGTGTYLLKAEFNADKTLAVVSGGKGVLVWHLGTEGNNHHLIREGEKPKEAIGIFFPAPDAGGQWKVATITTGPDAVVQIWNAHTGKPIGDPLEVNGRGLSQIHSPHFVISADGRRIAAAAGDSRIQIYDVGGDPDSWRLLHTLSGKTEASPDEGKVMGIRFNPVDDTQVVTFSVIGKTRIWDIDSGEQISEFDHSGRILDAGWSPDGSKIYTASQDGAQIWDVKSGKPHGPALAHANGVSNAAFSPDSRRIITTSGDTARIWDVETGLPLSGALKHDGQIREAHFSPNGRQVVTCGNDTTARLWEVPPVPDGPVPLWVLEWADSLFGLQMNERGTMEEIDWEKQKKIEEDAKSHIDDGFYGRTVEWFYDDPGTREITPFSQLTVDGYVRNRLDETTSYKGPHREASLEEALRVDPDNIEAFAKLAEVLLNGDDQRSAERLISCTVFRQVGDRR